jgi:transcriptional regulator with XRE-family HTH domain
MLREARIRAGLTQRELAAAAGTAQSVVARIETGHTTPTVETLSRLAEAAGFEIRWGLAPTRRSDPVIELYKRDVDRSLLRENLGKTPEERLTALAALERLADEAGRAGGAGGAAGSRKRSRKR